MPDETALDFSPFDMAPEANLPATWLHWLARALASQRAPLPPSPAPDWRGVLPALQMHGVLPLLYARLRNTTQWRELTPGTQAALTDTFRFNAIRTFLLDEELARISGTLAANRIPVMLLKGLATARLVFQNPAERLVNDMDLLVPTAHSGRALEALGHLGYQQQGLAILSRWQRRYRSEVALIGRERLLVELHWSLVESPYHIDRIDMVEVWRSSRPADNLANAWLPDLATLLIHGAAHLALHHSRQLRLIWLVDLDRLARCPQLDWDQVLQRTQRWQLGLAVKVALEVVNRWLETPVPEQVDSSLSSLAVEPIGLAMWGLGDDRPGRTWRRAVTTWSILSPGQRLRYAAWLGLRALTQPVEAIAHSSVPGKRPPARREVRTRTWAIL